MFSSNFNPTVVLLCCLLQEFITQTGRKLEVAAPKPPIAVTNAVSWRSEGIKHRKNEVFLDVIESVNLLVSAGGRVLHSDIVGSVQLRVQLSGPPCTALSSVCVCVCVAPSPLSLSLSLSLPLCMCGSVSVCPCAWWLLQTCSFVSCALFVCTGMPELRLGLNDKVG